MAVASVCGSCAYGAVLNAHPLMPLGHCAAMSSASCRAPELQPGCPDPGALAPPLGVQVWSLTTVCSLLIVARTVLTSELKSPPDRFETSAWICGSLLSAGFSLSSWLVLSPRLS